MGNLSNHISEMYTAIYQICTLPRKKAIETDIADDLWIEIFHFLNVNEFLLIEQLSKHFHGLTTNMQRKARINKYWKWNCYKLCQSIDESFKTSNWRLFYRELIKLLTKHGYVKCADIYQDKQNTKLPITLCETQHNCNMPPLLQAVQYDCLIIFKMLLSSQHNNDINVRLSAYVSGYNNDYNIDLTPLYVACSHGSRNIVKYLLSFHNIEIDCKSTKFADTPLMAASRAGHYRIVKLLIKYLSKKFKKMNKLVCYVNETNANGFNALHTACSQNNFQIVSLLLKYGANVNGTNSLCHTPLSIAAFEGFKRTVKVLLQNNNIDINGRTGRNNETALFAAVINNNVEICELLLQHGANSEMTDNDDQTVLMLAVNLNHVECIKVLIEYGANVNHKSKLLATPLSIACFKGHTESVCLLIRAKANMKNLEYPPLMMACVQGHLELIKLLIIEYNCDPSQPNIEGLTAFDVAVINGHCDVIEFIINHQ